MTTLEQLRTIYFQATRTSIADDFDRAIDLFKQLTDETEAYGIFPGGQSGNPGSIDYDRFIDDWAAGKYYRLWVMKKNEGEDERVKGVIKFRLR